jgi:DNA-binding PadR family transcriptional regulator
MYELITLSLLARGPVHGYVISTVINDVIGPFARASNGRVYPLLTSLEKAGLIVVKAETASEGGRVARTFAITTAGRARFRDLMLDTTQTPREYRDLFAFKVTAFDLVSKDDRVLLLRHYQDFAAAHVRHLEHQGRDIASAGYGFSAAEQAWFVEVFGHLVATWKREAAWATELLAQEQPRKRPKRRS